jgi:hypothetical protein
MQHSIHSSDPGALFHLRHKIHPFEIMSSIRWVNYVTHFVSITLKLTTNERNKLPCGSGAL